MPIFRFVCQACDRRSGKLLEPGELEDYLAKTFCEDRLPDGGECCGRLARETRAPGVVVKEVLDGPHVVRPVERFADAERLNKERHDKHRREENGS